VPEPVCDVPCVNLLRVKIGRLQVPQVVQPEAREFEAHEPREVVAVTEVTRVDRAAGRPAKQQAAVPVLRPEPEALFSLPQERGVDRGDGLVGQEHGPAAALRFWLAVGWVAAGPAQRPLDVDDPAVKRLFRQPEQFPEPGAGARIGYIEPVLGRRGGRPGVVEVRLELRDRGQCRLVIVGDRRRRARAWVPEDAARFDRMPKRGAKVERCGNSSGVPFPRSSTTRNSSLAGEGKVVRQCQHTSHSGG